MKCPIEQTTLQVDDDRSDGIHDFLGAHGRITAYNRSVFLVSGSINRKETMQRLWKIVYLVDKFNPGPWKIPRKRKWSAYLRPNQLQYT